MEYSINAAFMQGQWVAAWISALFTILAVIVGIMDPDRREKRLLRNIQILDGIKDYGDPYSINVLQARIEQEFEDINKPQLFSSWAKVLFTLYFLLLVLWTIIALLSKNYLLVSINTSGIFSVATGIFVAKLKLKRAYESSKEQELRFAGELSTMAKPALEIITKAILRGMNEDELMVSLNPESRAVDVYVNSFMFSPAEEALIKKTFRTVTFDSVVETELRNKKESESSEPCG